MNNSFDRFPVAKFTLAGDALEAVLDQFQAIIDDTADPATGKRGAGLPLYAIGCGFIVHRSGRRLDETTANALLAEHRASAKAVIANSNIPRFAARCADELALAIAKSFPPQEAQQ